MDSLESFSEQQLLLNLGRKHLLLRTISACSRQSILLHSASVLLPPLALLLTPIQHTLPLSSQVHVEVAGQCHPRV